MFQFFNLSFYLQVASFALSIVWSSFFVHPSFLFNNLIHCLVHHHFIAIFPPLLVRFLCCLFYLIHPISKLFRLLLLAKPYFDCFILLRSLFSFEFFFLNISWLINSLLLPKKKNSIFSINPRSFPTAKSTIISTRWLIAMVHQWTDKRAPLFINFFSSFSFISRDSRY